MPTNKQRREAERRRLQRQLEQRRQREVARRRFTLIASIVGTIVVIAAIVAVVIFTNSDSKKTSTASTKTSAATTPTSAAPTSSAAPLAQPTAPCAKPAKGATTSFKGVTVGSATDLKHAPKVSSSSSATPASLECADLVVGNGKPATPSSTVSVQYTGVLYTNGKQFDSSWSRGGKPISFSLAQVVPGFTQGIGGAGKVAPMREGGRRLMILPSSLGYGPQAQNGIPANSVLVFVVDLVKVT